MTEPFKCPRCGAVSHNPNDARERYCGRCHAFVDDEATLDKLLAAAYLDDAFEPRACNRCAKQYRGPAVYCSLSCALADA